MKIKTFGPVDERSLEAARALHGRRRRRLRRAVRRPSPRLQPADRRRDRLRGLRVAVGCRLRHRLRQQGGLHRADAGRPRGARRRRADHARDHASGSRSAWASRPRSAADHPVLDKIRSGRVRSRSASSRRTPSQPARHGRIRQPLRQPDGGRAGPRSGSASTSARAASATRPRRASSRSRRDCRSTAAPPRARWTRRRCCSRSAPSSATRTSRRWSWPASTPTPAATWSSPRCSRSSAPRRSTRCTTTTTSPGARSTVGRTYWVIRKGCTPARPGQEGFVGGSMGDDSVILEGVESDEAERVAVLDRPRRRPGDEPHAGRGQGPPAQALGVRPPRLRPRVRPRRRQRDNPARSAASAPSTPTRA